MRLAVSIGIALDDVDVEVLPNLFDEADVLAGELATGTRQRLQVGGQVVGALRFEPVGLRYRLPQPLRLTCEVGGVGLRLGFDEPP